MRFSYTHRADLQKSLFRWVIAAMVAWIAAIIVIGGANESILWTMIVASVLIAMVGLLPMPTDLQWAFLMGSVSCVFAAPIAHGAVTLPNYAHRLSDLCVAGAVVLVVTGLAFAGGRYVGRGDDVSAK